MTLSPSERGQKYHARRAEWNGVVYQSRLEADFAKTLDTLRNAYSDNVRVVWVAHQVPFTFPWGDKHVLDFIVGKADGSLCFVECKGLLDVKGHPNQKRELPLGRFKRKALEHYLGFEIRVWTKEGWK